MPKKFLITGGAGFVGSHVVDRAMREGHRVVVVDNFKTGRITNLEAHLSHPRFTLFHHDVSTSFPPAVEGGVEEGGYDAIIHLACPASPVHYQADPIGTTLTCVMGTKNVLTLAQRWACPIFIASTSEVYGDPIVHPQTEDYVGHVSCTGVRSCYDEGKRCAEALCFDFARVYGVKARVGRIFNTYGPRMCFDDGRIISNFMVQALRGDDITVYGTGEYTRSFQYVDDLVEAIWRFIEHPTEIGPINLGNPEEYSVLDMAKKIKELTNSTSTIVFKEAAKDDPKQRRPDISKAKAVLNWQPTVRVEIGLSRTKMDFQERLCGTEGRSRILIQCNPLLDISSHVDESFIAKYGVQRGAASLVTDAQKGIYTELEGRSDCVYVPGGSGLNTARVAQWMMQHPRVVTYVGCIADDDHGKKLRESAEKDGVNMSVEYTSKAPTGCCAVCVVGKERSLVASLGAANFLTRRHVESDVVQRAVGNSRIFYVTGFTLTLDKTLVLTTVRNARALGGIVMLNLSAPFIIQFFTSLLRELLEYADVVFSNDEEAQIFAKALQWETTDVLEIAQKTVQIPYNGAIGRTVVYTQGSKPTVFATASRSGEVPVKPIDPSKIIDTNGAGDAFVGGFLAAASVGRPLELCIEAGNYSAGVIIQNDGCTFPPKPEFNIME